MLSLSCKRSSPSGTLDIIFVTSSLESKSHQHRPSIHPPLFFSISSLIHHSFIHHQLSFLPSFPLITPPQSPQSPPLPFHLPFPPPFHHQVAFSFFFFHFFGTFSYSKSNNFHYFSYFQVNTCMYACSYVLFSVSSFLCVLFPVTYDSIVYVVCCMLCDFDG